MTGKANMKQTQWHLCWHFCDILLCLGVFVLMVLCILIIVSIFFLNTGFVSVYLVSF